MFSVEGQRYALHVSAVDSVTRAVEITPLPDAPPCVAGVINVHGKILPAFNLRRRFHLPDREIQPDDHMIIARAAHRRVVLLVDSVEEVLDCDLDEELPVKSVLGHTNSVEGMIKGSDGLIFIHDLNTFLSLDEEHMMEEALTSQALTL